MINSLLHFLDLSKAFDTVSHSTLLRNLDFYGIKGLCNDWFRNYLTDRQQIVKHKSPFSGKKKKKRKIKCGVPQLFPL